MITGKQEELQAMADNNVCAADGGHLSAAWDAKGSVYYLRCGICNITKGIQRVLSPTEELKTGAELPPGVKDNVEKGIARRQEKQKALTGAVTMGGIPATDLGTGELLNIEVLKGLVDYAHRYGLDPRRGHVCLMYGKPYITLDGYLYHAHKTGGAFIMASRPLTSEEKLQYMVEKDSHAWHCGISLPDTQSHFDGIGIVTVEEMTEKSKRNPTVLAAPVVARHPWQLAQKRSEWQALRRAFPIGESDKEEVK